ncbi:MAG: DUF4012 domain-containing protein [bacterium]|nr:DUF4012 domain-containing protein [bacterium]
MIYFLKKFPYKLLLLTLLSLSLISPILFFIFNIFLGLWSLNSLENSLQKNDFKNVAEKSFTVSSSFNRANYLLQLGQPVYRLLGLDEKVGKISYFFQFAQISAEAINEGLFAANQANKIFSASVNNQSINFDQNFNELKSSIKKSYEKISLAQSFLDNFSGQEIFFGQYFLRAKKDFPKISRFLQDSQVLTEVAPKILDTRGRKTYLVLFQNNMELRPTGGFIGSYALLSLDRGKLLDFEVHDVYFADGQLKGHVDPPAKLREFLGQENLFLRDSNWDPDFPTSAKRAEWFLEKETGRTVDGVIALDLFTAQRLISTFGEINLPDYQETVNADNFFQKAQFHSEVGFFPGSTGKRDFLGAVSNALFERLKNANQKELLEAGKGIFQSLSEKDILIYLNDEKVMGQIAGINYDGGLKRTKCGERSVKCVEDYLMIVEANLGVNKSNFFLSRSLELTAKIGEDGSIDKNLVINYQNKSPNDIFPAGKYKNYLRVYLPQGSQITSLTINNPSNNDETSVNWDTTTEHDLSVFGFLVEVPAIESRQVKMTYHLPKGVETGHYKFLWQKQPGTRNDRFNLIFSPTPNWLIIPQTDGVLTRGGGLLYNGDLSNDRVFDLEVRNLNK